MFVDIKGGNDHIPNKGKPKRLLYITRILAAVLSLRPADIVIIAPYLGQVALYKQTLRRILPGVTVATADSFQDWEKSLVLRAIVSGENTGPALF
jgi:hypothetical protein